jgi:hypothetical protein
MQLEFRPGNSPTKSREFLVWRMESAVAVQTKALNLHCECG